MRYVLAVLCSLLFISFVQAEERFTSAVGNVPVGEVQMNPLVIPTITWGGDVVTYYANGGRETTPDSIYGKLGLKIRLVNQDKFVEQVRDYTSGKSPFARATFGMLGLASEHINKDPRTRGVMGFQLTWSLGDHLVVNESIKKISDLRGRTIALQKYGPHICGLLSDVLETGQLSWDDVKIVWAENLTGKDSPAELFRNGRVDAACVISPDMIGLTGGLKTTGTGAEGTVKGSRVLVSTNELSRSIADVYIVRSDFADRHGDIVEKFAAGYFKAAEELVALKKEYDSTGSPKYVEVLKMAQNIFGKEVLPTIDVDAAGFVADCSIVGLPGNVSFFEEPNNITGFEAMQKGAMQLARDRGYVAKVMPYTSCGLDYHRVASMVGLAKVQIAQQGRFRAEAVQHEIETFQQTGTLDEQTIYSFTIKFKPEQIEFPIEEYGEDLGRAIDLSRKYGNAVLACRGHADPSKTMIELVRAGLSQGILSRSGSPGNFQYSINGAPLDLSKIDSIVSLIETGAFDGVADHNPREVMQSALNLSRRRAEAVKSSMLQLAKRQNKTIDESQIQVVGVGIREPFVAKPKNLSQAEQNMRVEFRLVRVNAESMQDSDFNY